MANSSALPFRAGSPGGNLCILPKIPRRLGMTKENCNKWRNPFTDSRSTAGKRVAKMKIMKKVKCLQIVAVFQIMTYVISDAFFE